MMFNGYISNIFYLQGILIIKKHDTELYFAELLPNSNLQNTGKFGVPEYTCQESP